MTIAANAFLVSADAVRPGAFDFSAAIASRASHVSFLCVRVIGLRAVTGRALLKAVIAVCAFYLAFSLAYAAFVFPGFSQTAA